MIKLVYFYISQQLRKAIRARLGASLEMELLEGREENKLLAWCPAWCGFEKVGRLCQDCDKGVFWVLGGKGRYTTLRPPESWEGEHWHRIKIKLPVGEDMLVEHKCRVSIKHEHKVNLPITQGIQMALRVRKVRVEVTSAPYDPEKNIPGLTTVLIIARVFHAKTVEVLIAGRTMWSTCPAFVKYACYPKVQKGRWTFKVDTMSWVMT